MSKIAIIGVGAMGCLYAAKLCEQHQVVMIGHWPEQLAALNHGLGYIDVDGSERLIPLHATDKPELLPKVDLVLVVVKGAQTERAAAQAKLLLDESSDLRVVLTLQNGVGNIEKLYEAVGKGYAMVGTTTQGAMIPQVGVVINKGYGPIDFGPLPVSENSEHRQQLVRQVFEQAGWETRMPADIDGIIWRKLAINAGINPLTAILKCKNGLIGERPEAYQLMKALAEETVAVAEAMGIQVPNGEQIESQVYTVTVGTASNTSSMLSDVLRNAETEIENICGEVIRQGARLGVATPVNGIAYQMVKEIERGEREPNEQTDLAWL